MLTVVNLSALHTLYPHIKSLTAFTEICKAHTESCCRVRFFQRAYNFLWVLYTYNTSYNTLINPFRRGELTSEEFFNNLKSMFAFLEDTDLSETKKLDMLKSAWNAIIGMEADVVDRFASIVAEASDDNPVVLISNTNAWNIDMIMQLFRQRNPELPFRDPAAIHAAVTKDTKDVEILPHVTLRLSFRHGAFKTAEQNPPTTMSLLNGLIAYKDKTQVRVISQFQGDLDEAGRLGVPASQRHLAADYFAELAHTHAKSM